MKKIFLVLIVTVLVAIVSLNVISHKKPEVESDRPVVKIGAILPMTGNMAHAGTESLKAIRLAVAEVNTRDDRVFDYELISEDDQAMPNKTVIAANKLVSYDKINAVLTLYGSPAKAIKPIVTAHKIIQFSATYSSEFPDGQYNFQNYVSVDELTSGTLEWLEMHKAKRVALLFQQVSSSEELLTKLKPALQEKQIQYSDYFFNTGERDFRLTIAKLKSKGYDAVLLFGFVPEILLASKELKIQKVGLPVLGYDLFELANYKTDFVEGFYTIGVPDNQHWAEEMGLESSYSADYLYDSVNIIMQTYERAGHVLGRVPTADEFREFLYQRRNYEGVVGKIYLEDNGQFRSPAYLKQIVGGNLKLVE